MTEHRSMGNEVVKGGIIHKCSCGWVSRPCFSNMTASALGMDHRDEYVKITPGDEVRLRGHT